MRANKQAIVIIPAFNEEEKISETVRAVLSVPEVTNVLVVDDGSTDHTASAARLAGAKVLSLPSNVGKGKALNYGLGKIREGNAEVIVLLDADLGATAKEAARLLAPVLEGKADMTVARFPASARKAGFGLVKRLAAEGIRYYTGLKTGSPLSGQRAMTREVLFCVTPFASGFGVEVALTIKAARAGFRILEVPVNMGHKETGRNLRGFLHRGKQFWHVVRTLWEIRNWELRVGN